METSTSEIKQVIQQKAINFLKRYFYLIVFTAYVKEQFSSKSLQNFEEKFEKWMYNHPELYSLLKDCELV